MNNANDIEFDFSEKYREQHKMEAHHRPGAVQSAVPKDMLRTEWRAADFPESLCAAGMDSFTSLWEADIPWLEEPNFHRRGWSGVVSLTLGEETFFIKRQQQFCFYSLRYPLGKPTLWREWRNIGYCQSLGLPAPEVVYYGESRDKRALLVTRGIDTSYIPFIDYLNQKHSGQDRRAVIEALSTVLNRMARYGLRHGCCYAKHFFVRHTAEHGVQVCLIDLEKMRQRRRHRRARNANLNQLLGHLPELTEAERAYFIQLVIPDENERAPLAAEIQRRLVRHIARNAAIARAGELP